MLFIVILFLLFCPWVSFCDVSYPPESSRASYEVKSADGTLPSDSGMIKITEAQDDKYSIHPHFKPMRIESSDFITESAYYNCYPDSPEDYFSSMTWAYNLKGSWEWCGDYCRDSRDSNIVTDHKLEHMKNVIIPLAIEKVIAKAPLIIRQQIDIDTVTFLSSVVNNIYIGYDEEDDKSLFPDTDVVIYFSISPVSSGEYRFLSWSKPLYSLDGRVIASLVNINPCTIMKDTEKTVNAVAEKIEKSLSIDQCPDNNSVLLHYEKNYFNSVSICVKVHCNNNRTYHIEFKNGKFFTCEEMKLSYGKYKWRNVCPTFDDLCKLTTEEHTDEIGPSVETETENLPIKKSTLFVPSDEDVTVKTGQENAKKNKQDKRKQSEANKKEKFDDKWGKADENEENKKDKRNERGQEKEKEEEEKQQKEKEAKQKEIERERERKRWQEEEAAKREKEKQEKEEREREEKRRQEEEATKREKEKQEEEQERKKREKEKRKEEAKRKQKEERENEKEEENEKRYKRQWRKRNMRPKRNQPSMYDEPLPRDNFTFNEKRIVKGSDDDYEIDRSARFSSTVLQISVYTCVLSIFFI